jgi:hypothetical protein
VSIPNDLLASHDDIQPTYFRSIPSGAWTRLENRVPVFVISQSATPAASIQRTLNEPNIADDETSYDTSALGWAYIPAKGLSWIKHNGANPENFKVIDARCFSQNETPTPGPGGSPATTGLSNRGAGFTAIKTVAVPSTAENCAAQAIPNGFALVVKALPTNTGNTGVGFSQAAADLVTGAPFYLEPGASVRYFITNANLLWIDTIVAGNGVCLTAEI